MEQKSKPVSILDCMTYKGKLYRPGTVFKVSEQWIKDHYEYIDGEYKVDLFTYGNRFWYDYNPHRYYLNGYKEVPMQCGGYLCIKSLYWEFKWVNSKLNYYCFVPVINPYVTKDDVYFVEKSLENEITKDLYYNPCLSSTLHKLRNRIIDLNDRIPEYVDVSRFLSERHIKNYVNCMDYMINPKYTDEMIEEVIEPLEWSRKHGANENHSAEALIGWVVYIAAMIAASIFVDKVFIWVFLTLAWILIRQMILNNVR
jgi:hypothetical protein